MKRLFALLFFCFCSYAYAYAYASSAGSITILGGERFNGSIGLWDSGTVSVSINGYLKSVSYGQFSTPASIAAAIAAKFSSDCYGPANAKATPDGMIYVKVRNGGQLTDLSVNTYSSMSFLGSTNTSISPTSIAATIGSTQLLLGGSTNIDVQVSCNSACGQVDYRIDGSEWGILGLDGSGHASATTPTNLTSGLHNVIVKFLGNGSYTAAVSNPVSFTISNSSAPTNPIGLYSYNINSYAPNGNVQAYSDSVNGNWFNIGYDELNRLKSASQSVNGATQYLCWNYDSFGNRTAQAVSGSPCTDPSPTSSYNVNNRDQGLQYDAAGSVLSDGHNLYRYDAEGRICAVQYQVMAGLQGMIGYVYDAEGRRVAKGTIHQWSCDVSSNGFQETAGYVVGPNNEQMAETNASGEWVHSNVYANGELIATYTPNDMSFHINDWLSTRRIDMDPFGNLGASYQNMPFGEFVVAGQSLGSTEHFFTGKERDTESGLDNFGKRYYASTMGRFMSPDPMMIMKQKFTDPQQWNMYSYTRNNPLRFTDPTGMYVCADSSKCDSKNDKAFQAQLNNLRKAQAGYKAGSAEYDKIAKVLSNYGGAGDTGTAGGKTVSVSFNGAATSSGATTQMLDKSTIGVNFSSSFSQQADNNTLGTSVLVGHEGQHVTDGAPTGTARLGSEINAESTSQAIVGGYAAQGMFEMNMNPGTYFEVRGIISWDPTMSGNSSSAINGARGAAIRIGIEDYKDDMANDKK
jgi:RHS repeat-associated protein